MICRDSDEQRRFYRLFDDWLAGKATSADQDTAVAKPAESSSAESLDERYRKAVSPWWLLPLVASIVLGLAWFFYTPSLPVLTPEPPKPAQETEKPEVPTPGPELERVILSPRQPREPAPTPAVPPERQAQLDLAGRLLPWLPLLIALVALLQRYRARPVLHAAAERADARLSHLRIDDRQVPLFAGQSCRPVYRSLRQPIRFPSRRLDVNASVDATTRRAGYFIAHYAERAHVPEYVVLIDRAHRNDHSAALADALVVRLRDEGLPVHAYSYRGDPQRLYQPKWPDLPTMNLHELAARHEHSRLLLEGDGEGLIQAFSGRPQLWLDAFERWPWRAFLSTAADTGEYIEAVLVEQGFAVAPLSADGLSQVVAVLSMVSAVPDRGTQRRFDTWPEVLGRHEWLHRLPAEKGVYQKLENQLKDYLGEHGLLLLRAMAAYPGVYWGLTRALDLYLNPDDLQQAEFRDARLLAVARLPWAREGYMPEELRERLLRGLSRKQRRAVQQVYNGIMERLTLGRGDQPTLELPIAIADTPDSRMWGDLRRQVPPDSPLNDHIFATILRGGHPGSLEFELSKRVGRLLGPAPTQVKWLPGILTLLAAVLVGGLLSLGWSDGVRPALERRLEALPPIPGQLATAEVRILHSPEVFQQAAALRASLADWQLPTPLLERRDEKDATLNTVRYGNGDLAEAAQFVADRLRYISYGSEVALLEDPRVVGIEVELVADHAAGGVFRDPLSRAWVAEAESSQATVTQATQTEVEPDTASPEVEPESEATFEVLVLPSFRDPLRGGGEGPEMVVLPAGEFTMGSPKDEVGRDSDEGPQRPVRVSSFAIGRTEVSFDDYDRFAKASGRGLPDDEGWGRGSRPVINVSWDDANAYAAWLSEQTGQAYRLPSEAEWEYAARAGTTTARFWGDAADQACRFANVYDQAGEEAHNVGWDTHPCNDGQANTAPVGSFAPNGFGLYDMLGNVWEWVADCWFDSYEGAPGDAAARDGPDGSCEDRVVRGGGWNLKPAVVRSANRDRFQPDVADFNLGFRLARTKPP